MKKSIRVDLAKARAFFLNKQLLNTTRKLSGKKGVTEIIDTLGYIQIDTINVIERSHHIVLFTRCSDYKKEFLHTLQAKEKKIFEYWAHAASFIPMKDYRFYIRKMKEKPRESSWFGMWIKKHRKILKRTKTRIEKEGPLCASDFSDIKDRKRGPWWDWKPAKAALEILFWRGELMIRERKKFQRVYDLTERILPDNIDTTIPDINEEKMFFVRRALKALGLATMQDINKYIGISGRLNKWVDKMIEAGEINEVAVADLNRPYYILSHDISKIKRAENELIHRVMFLSPFDNSIILRERTAALFGFNYSLECYVPKSRRKYGYFCLPILWHNRFVGRIDPKADRYNKTLLINNLHLEDNKLGKAFYKAFNVTLKNLCEFHGCTKISMCKVPDEIKNKIIA
ncbi:MAG: crosslink repair DNA glycosylase YcaQ family protein [bacterium]